MEPFACVEGNCLMTILGQLLYFLQLSEARHVTFLVAVLTFVEFWPVQSIVSLTSLLRDQ